MAFEDLGAGAGEGLLPAVTASYCRLRVNLGGRRIHDTLAWVAVQGPGPGYPGPGPDTPEGVPAAVDGGPMP